MLSIAAREWAAEGAAKARVEMLSRQFRRNFGTLSAEVESRLQSASTDQLDEWSERFVDAASLDEVFATDAPRSRLD